MEQIEQQRATLYFTTSGTVRPCRGVPASLPDTYGQRQGPEVTCSATVSGRLADRCDSCAQEIERRYAACEAEKNAAALRKGLERAGLAVPFVCGVKMLDTLRELSPQHGPLVAALRDWLTWGVADGCRLNVLVRGGAGIGKTHALQGVIREAVIAGRRAMYINCRDFALRLQSSFRDDARESSEAILNGLTRRDGPALFLAVDDIGATKVTRFVSDSIYTLLDRRAQNELPTIVSTNYERMSELAARMLPQDGDAFDAIRPIDRLEELCPKVITLGGVSQRSTMNREPGRQPMRDEMPHVDVEDYPTQPGFVA